MLCYITVVIIPYSGKLSREKFRGPVGSERFTEKAFVGCGTVNIGVCGTPKWKKKLARVANNPQNMCLPRKFPAIQYKPGREVVNVLQELNATILFLFVHRL